MLYETLNNGSIFLPPFKEGMYIDSRDYVSPIDWRYNMELFIYGSSSCLGVFAFIYTLRRLIRTDRKDLVIAARLLSYKISLTVADVLILFLYAPSQFIWISTFWWYGGDSMCKIVKFLTTLGFHLTANMQVLIAFDRLYITGHMSTCRLDKKRKEPYNTRMCLFFAWFLALLCSFPQLLIFGVSKTSDGHEQCISVWLHARLTLFERSAYLDDYHLYLEKRSNFSSELYSPNGELLHDLTPPYFSKRSVEDEAMWYQTCEQVYNVIHLTMICILPYLIEMTCYSMILYILKGAQQGTFLSITDAIKRIFCISRARSSFSDEVVNRTSSLCSPTFIPRCSSNLSTLGSVGKDRWQYARTSTTEMEPKGMTRIIITDENDIPISSLSPKAELLPPMDNGKLGVTKEKRSASCSNVDSYSGFQPFRPNTLKLNSDVTRIACKDTKCSVLPRCYRLPFKRRLIIDTSRMDPPCKILGIEVNLPAIRIINTEMVEREANGDVPWLATVFSARRRARQKASLMLTCNLLLWAPYCIVGIVNSITVFTTFADFQFVAAIVTFNAVINILL